jgi:hypothetical protein
MKDGKTLIQLYRKSEGSYGATEKNDGAGSNACPIISQPIMIAYYW